MERMVLTFHDWRQMKSTDKSDPILLFLFSLVSEADHAAGIQPDHNQTFWTEVSLSRDLAGRGSWKTLSKGDTRKALFQFACESIEVAGRKLRQAPLFWRPGDRLEKGPPWDLSTVKFPKAHACVVEVPDTAIAERAGARKGAGLSEYSPPG